VRETVEKTIQMKLHVAQASSSCIVVAQLMCHQVGLICEALLARHHTSGSLHCTSQLVSPLTGFPLPHTTIRVIRAPKPHLQQVTAQALHFSSKTFSTVALSSCVQLDLNPSFAGGMYGLDSGWFGQAGCKPQQA
jgi:hypothetical protein